jgi:hypothetical protein
LAPPDLPPVAVVTDEVDEGAPEVEAPPTALAGATTVAGTTALGAAPPLFVAVAAAAFAFAIRVASAGSIPLRQFRYVNSAGSIPLGQRHQGLRQDACGDFAVNVGQSEIAAGVAIG